MKLANHVLTVASAVAAFVCLLLGDKEGVIFFAVLATFFRVGTL